MNTEFFNTKLLDSLTTAVVVLDSKLCLFHMNPSAEALLQTSDKHSRNAYIGKFLPKPTALIRSLRNVQEADNTFIARKVSLQLADGTKLIVDYSISNFTEDYGEFLIMEIQELDRSYHISRKEALISKHETTLELVRGLGHEIKNPLGGIRGAAQLLAQELNDPELQDYTGIIMSEADRLVKLVDRLTGSYKKPDNRAANIHEVLERVKSLLDAESQGAVEIIRDYDPSLPEIIIDVEQMIQAVLNIARNAMQAMTESDMQDKQPRITMRTRAAANVTIGAVLHKLLIRVEIIDNGPGIKPEIMDNIFYPLISGRAEGNGLGLSIAQTIVKNHNGLIECDSQEGKTTFIISLPLVNKEGLTDD